MMLTGQYLGRTGWIEHYDVPRWGGAGLIPDKFPTWPQLLHAHGFDHHCVWPGGEEGNPPTERRYWDAYLQTDGQRKIHSGEYGPDITQRFALEFIRQNQRRPFMLYYPMIAVHAPNEPTPLNRDHLPSGEDTLYASSVSYLDRQVGELLDEIM